MADNYPTEEYYTCNHKSTICGSDGIFCLDCRTLIAVLSANHKDYDFIKYKSIDELFYDLK